MIDRKARNKLAELLRSLSVGLITNDEFEDSLPHSDDEAIRKVFYYGGWTLYSDLKEYKLNGKNALETIVKKEVARWVLFLKSDFEYRWPEVPFKSRVLHTLTMGLYGTTYEKVWAANGDIEVWPFLKVEDFESAKETYGYLGK